LTRFNNAEICWCQEEPKNQGAWSFIEPNLEWVLKKIRTGPKRPTYVGRAASASPATGLAAQHKNQQTNLIDEALNILGESDD
jgi:2-oxoglutarate dehydrogenase E1 component